MSVYSAGGAGESLGANALEAEATPMEIGYSLSVSAVVSEPPAVDLSSSDTRQVTRAPQRTTDSGVAGAVGSDSDSYSLA